MLSQLQDGEEKPLAYYSQALSRQERQYCVTRRKLLAVVKAVRHFHPYLYGLHFTIRTDHAALKWLLSFCPEGQVACWLQQLQEYDFVVEHRPGLKHNNADALSRRPCLLQPCRHCDQLESREFASTELSPAQQNCASCEVPLPVSVARLQVDSVSQPQGQHPETDNLLTAQQQDPDIQTLLTWLEKGIRPPWTIVAPLSEIVKCYWAQWNSIHLKDGIIYRLWESPVGDRVVWQIVLPEMLQREVFQQLHSSPTAGHLGITKTLSRVRERFYWARNHRDIEDWCRSCDLCASKKGPPATE